MSNRRLKYIPYWRLAIVYGVVFIVIVFAIEFIINFFKTDDISFITNAIQKGSWLKYLISRIVMGIFYGAMMSYWTKKKK